MNINKTLLALAASAVVIFTLTGCGGSGQAPPQFAGRTITVGFDNRTTGRGGGYSVTQWASTDPIVIPRSGSGTFTDVPLYAGAVVDESYNGWEMVGTANIVIVDNQIVSFSGNVTDNGWHSEGVTPPAPFAINATSATVTFVSSFRDWEGKSQVTFDPAPTGMTSGQMTAAVWDQNSWRNPGQAVFAQRRAAAKLLK